MKGRAPEVPSKQKTDFDYEGFTLTALLYRLNECKTWDLVEEAFVPLGVEWREKRNSSITKFLHVFYVKDKEKVGNLIINCKPISYVKPYIFHSIFPSLLSISTLVNICIM